MVTGGGEQNSKSIPLPIYNDQTSIHTSITTEVEMVTNRPTPDRVEAEEVDYDKETGVQQIGHGRSFNRRNNVLHKHFKPKRYACGGIGWRKRLLRRV